MPEREAGRADRRARARAWTPAVGRRRGTRRRRAVAEYVSPSSGACTTPTTGSPSATSAIDTPTDGEAVQEVRGAVERVDEPAERRPLAARLLAEDRRCRARRRRAPRRPRPRSRCRRRSPSRPAPSRGRCSGPPNACEHDRAAGAAPRRSASVTSAVEIERAHAAAVRSVAEQLGRARGDELPARVRIRGRRAAVAARSTTCAPASMQTSSPPR